MDQATQQNAAMVEESTAASHKLTAETEELGALLAQFRVGSETTAARSAPVPASARSRPAPSPALHLISRVARAHGTTAPAADNWEEF